MTKQGKTRKERARDRMVANALNAVMRLKQTELLARTAISAGFDTPMPSEVESAFNVINGYLTELIKGAKHETD